MEHQNWVELPHTLNNLYSELFRLVVLQTPNGAGFSFATKTIKGKKYWYIKTRIFGKVKDIYFGKDTVELRHEIDQLKEKWTKGGPTIAERKRLVAMLKRGGVFSVSAPFSTYLTHLEGSGVFLAGGILVGSHAFNLYQNLLNIQWTDQRLMQTGDIDIAAANQLAVGLPSSQLDTDDVILSSGLSFERVFNYAYPKSGPTKYVSDRGYEIEFITPQSGNQTKPVKIKRLGIEASPVKHLEFLFKDVRQAVAVNGAGLLVNVPNPTHYAFHKLAISQARKRNPAKVRKDISQAECIISWVLQHVPGDLLTAYEDVKTMPKQFQTQFRTSIQVSRMKDLLQAELGVIPQ